MSPVIRFFWMVTLLIFAGGCSSYRVVTDPFIEDDWETNIVMSSAVKIGDKVKITLVDHSKAEGKIMTISYKDLTLEPIQPAQRIPGDYPPRVIMFDSILVVEKQEHDSNKTSLLVVGVIVGSLGVLALSIAASGGMGMNFGLK